LKVTNPATEQVIKELPDDNTQSVIQKFEKAKNAQKAWASTPFSERKKCVEKFRKGIEKKSTELAEIMTLEVGKPITQSHNELKGLLGRIDYFLENTARVLEDQIVWKDPVEKLEERISQEPLGVIGNISAWNYPYFVGSNVWVPALLTGNAVLYKPSEFSSMTGIAVTELWHESGVPDDIFIQVLGGGNVGAELVKQPLNGIFFTGSYPTGQRIAQAAAPSLMRVQLELGGKDPIYVTEDVDPVAVAPGIADGAFYNNGQSCCSVERIYVHESVYERFVEVFVETVKGFVLGDPMDPKTYLGPLARSPQIQVIEKQIGDARSKGAKILCGGKRVQGKGFFFEPTVLVDVNHTMEVMREESFGPVIGIQKVASDEEALALMNDTAYGLTAGVYSRKRAKAEPLLAQLNSGSVYWNCCDRVNARLPWSGRGHSGMGSTLSQYGIHAFLQPKAWHLRG
jgi:acyl-CoA reductase-like NAD-dependent aldehyde dehydrogenase